MGPAAPITPVRATQGGEFVAAKMFNTRPTMSTPAKDPDLVNKIAFFHNKNIRRSKIGSYEGESISMKLV